MDEKEFVTYLVTYSGTLLPKYYIGSTSKTKIENGYLGSIGSKKWKSIFKSEVKNNRYLFDIVIVDEYNSRLEALEAEYELQLKLNVVKSPEFYNESYACVNGFFGRECSGVASSRYGNGSNYDMWVRKFGIEIADEKLVIAKKHLSETCAGKLNGMYGRKDEVVAIDITTGVKCRVTRDEFESNHNLKGHSIGMMGVIEISTGKLVNISKDEFYKNKAKYRHGNEGTIHSIETREKLSKMRVNMTTIKDWDGNFYRVNMYDERCTMDGYGNASSSRWMITDPDNVEYKTMRFSKFFKNKGLWPPSQSKNEDGMRVFIGGGTTKGWHGYCLD